MQRPPTPMRIGLYHATLPTAGHRPEGVAVFVDRLARHLQDRGHQVTCLSFSPPPEGAPYGHRQIAPGAAARTTLRRIALAPWILNLVDTADLDVLHLHGDDWFFLRRRLPTVRTFHGSALWEGVHAERLRRRLAMFAATPLELAASYLATSAYAVGDRQPRAYATHGALPPGVELDPDPALERPPPPSVLFIGTWTGRKRGRMLETLVRERVRPHVPNAELWMVSDECHSHDPHVRWFRAPSDSELRSLLRRAWVLCAPSLYEGFGIPALEAIASGTPVVASPNPGSRYVLDEGRAGAVVGDEDLAAAIVRVLTDRRHRRELALAGRRRAEAFDWPVTIERHERAYGLAIRRWQSRRAGSRG